MTAGYNSATALERVLVEFVAKRVRERGIEKGEFAVLVWPEDSPKVVAARWTTVRNKVSSTSKPQGMQISDAQRMAEVLGEDLSYLMAITEEQARVQAEA